MTNLLYFVLTVYRPVPVLHAPLLFPAAIELQFLFLLPVQKVKQKEIPPLSEPLPPLSSRHMLLNHPDLYKAVCPGTVDNPLVQERYDILP